MILFEIIAAVLFLIGVAFVAFDNYGKSLIYTVAVLALAWFFVHPVHDFLTAIGWHSLLLKWFPLYLAAGVVTALIKWFFLVVGRASKIRATKEDLASRAVRGDLHAKNPDANVRRKYFLELYNQSYAKYGEDHVDISGIKEFSEEVITDLLTPRAKKYVDKITFWVLEWPYVIVSTFVKDFLIEFTRWVARVFDYLFTQMSRALIARASKGI